MAQLLDTYGVITTENLLMTSELCHRLFLHRRSRISAGTAVSLHSQGRGWEWSADLPHGGAAVKKTHGGLLACLIDYRLTMAPSKTAAPATPNHLEIVFSIFNAIKNKPSYDRIYSYHVDQIISVIKGHMDLSEVDDRAAMFLDTINSMIDIVGVADFPTREKIREAVVCFIHCYKQYTPPAPRPIAASSGANDDDKTIGSSDSDSDSDDDDDKENESRASKKARNDSDDEN